MLQKLSIINSQVVCGTTGLTTTSCSNCPELGEWACTSPTCAWMTHTNLCRDVFADGVRTAAVHLVYDAPREVRQPAWWLQELTVKASSDATLFSTNGHNFGFGSVLEVRKDPFLGRVTFSIKGENNEGAKTIACGSGITCDTSNNDISSVTSFFDTTELPVKNEQYYFITHAQPISDDGNIVDYSGFFHAPSFPTWKFLSRIRINTGNKFWWHGGIFSSIEQQEPVNTFENRMGLFGPSFMSDLTNDPTGRSFFQIKSAYFSFGLSDNHEHINAFHENGAVGLATGGDAVQEVSKWTRFAYPRAVKPDALTVFANFIPCLNTATDALSIESCLLQKISDENE